jgi:hypothetical protein
MPQRYRRGGAPRRGGALALRAVSKARKAPSRRGAASRAIVNGPRPDVIVDFNCADGMLHVMLKNIGNASAYGIECDFDKPLIGLNGEKRISDLQLFRRVEFMPPGKEFVQLVDPIAAWLKRRQDMKFAITVAYSDRDGRRFRERIVHDLRIYRDLGYTRMLSSGGTDGKRTQ